MTTRIRPMGIREIFDYAFAIIRERFWTFQKLIFISFLPSMGLFLLMLIIAAVALLQIAPGGMAWGRPEFWTELGNRIQQNPIPLIIVGIILFFLFLALLIFTYIGFFYFTYGNVRLFSFGLHGISGNLKEAFSARKGRILKIFLVSLLLLVINAIVTIPFSFLNIFLNLISPVLGVISSLTANLLQLFVTLIFCLAPVIAALENRDVMAVLTRAFKLFSKNCWKTIGVLLLAFLLEYVLVLAAISMIFIPIALFFVLKSVWLLIPIALLLCGFFLILNILICLQQGLTTILYYDIVVRLEGYDLQLQLDPGQATGPYVLTSPERGFTF